jgi:hypothetical protein
MNARGLLVVCVVLVAVAVALSAQQVGVTLDPQFTAKLQSLEANDSAGLFQLAMESFKAGLYTETRAAADQLLALDTGDTRGLYLKQATDFYLKGSYTPVAGAPPVVPPITNNGIPSPPPGGNVINLTDEEVDTVYKDFTAPRMTQFRNLQNTLFLRRCATEQCHGNTAKSGPFYMKSQNANERKTIAENFKAMINYVNNLNLGSSRILSAAADSDTAAKHAGGQVLRESDSAYRELKTFVEALPGNF